MTQPIEFSSHQAIKQSVLAQLLSHDGFVLIQGDVGSGKTRLKDQLIKALRSRLLVLDLPYCRYNFDELLFTLADRLKVRYQKNSLDSCQQALSQFTQLKERTGTPFSLIIDDAQFIPLETLQALKEATSNHAPARLALRGILFSDRSLSEKLQFQFMENNLLSTVINMPRLTESDMHHFISDQLTQSGSYQIDPMAEQLILISAAGNLRRAKQLVQQGIALCQQQQSALISEDMIEELTGADDQLPVLEPSSALGSSGVPADLQGILTQSLLDTPEKPVLKQKKNSPDIPLFVNDLSNAQVNAIPASALQGNLQDATDQPQLVKAPPDPIPQPPPADEITATAAQNSQRTTGMSHAATEHHASPAAEDIPQQVNSGIDNEPLTEKSAEKTAKPTRETPAAPQEAALVATREETLKKPVKEPDQDQSAMQPPRPAKPLRWVAAAGFVLLIGTLGWLASQPGFNPMAKIEQLKQQALSLVEKISTSPANKEPLATTETPQLSESIDPSSSQLVKPNPVSSWPENEFSNNPLPPSSKPTDISTTDTADAPTPEAASAEIVAAPVPTISSTTAPQPLTAETKTTAKMTEALLAIESQLAQLEQQEELPVTANEKSLNDTHSTTPIATVQSAATSNDNEQHERTTSPPVSTKSALVTTSPEQRQDAESLLHAEAMAAQLAMLKKKAQIHLDNHRYTIPEVDNAVLTLRRMLRVDADNGWAQEQLQWITGQYMDRAKVAEAAGNRPIAVQNYARLLWINPDQAEARAALNRLSNRQNAPIPSQ